MSNSFKGSQHEEGWEPLVSTLLSRIHDGIPQYHVSKASPQLLSVWHLHDLYMTSTHFVPNFSLTIPQILSFFSNTDHRMHSPERQLLGFKSSRFWHSIQSRWPETRPPYIWASFVFHSCPFCQHGKPFQIIKGSIHSQGTIRFSVRSCPLCLCP